MISTYIYVLFLMQNMLKSGLFFAKIRPKKQKDMKF
jgi:hypothetical protein